MVGFVLAFVAGQLLSAWVAAGPAAAGWAWVGLGLGVAAPRARGARTLRLLASAVIGVWLVNRASLVPADCFLPESDGAEKQWIEGVVLEASASTPDRRVIAARAAVARGGERRPVCGRVLLTLVGGGSFPGAGERFRVHAHLRRPRNFANPGAEDRVGVLARRGIFVTAFAKWTADARLGREPTSLRGALGRRRELIAARIDEALPAPERALVRALVLGDGSAIPDRVRDDLVAAGLAHLLAVSGLHVGAVWGAFFVLVNAALSRSETLLLRTHVRATAAVAALVPAAAYGALAGGRAPTARAVLMIGLLALALGAGREVTAIRVVALAAGGLAAASPGAPLDVSWQLSFAAVAGIVAGMALCHDRIAASGSPIAQRLLPALLVPGFAFFATAPLTAYHFGRIAPAGLVTNPVLVPLAGIPATLLGLAGAALTFVSDAAASAAFRLAGIAASWLLAAAGWAAAFPYASVGVPTPTLLEIGLLYAALSLPAWGRGVRRGAVALLLVLAGLDVGFWVHERSAHTDLRVRFLDVGQGDAAVVELPHGGVLVVDGGGFARSHFDVGERVVAPYLRRRRILRVDALVVTHGDWDHQGGLHALAREFAPRELWRSVEPRETRRLGRLEDAVRASGGRIRTVGAGTVLHRGGVAIEVLHPPRGEGAASSNDASLVLRLDYGSTSVLLTGDLEAPGEARLVARGVSGAEVLKVPHHGSRTSSTRAFLTAIRPRFAVVSVAAGNRYGLPHPEVLARYRRSGTRLLRTDREGSVRVVSDGRRLVVRPFEESRRIPCDLLGVLC